MVEPKQMGRRFAYPPEFVEREQRNLTLRILIPVVLGFILFLVISLTRYNSATDSLMILVVIPFLIIALPIPFIYWKFGKKRLAALASWELEINEDQIAWWRGGQPFMRLMRSDVTDIEETQKLLTLRTKNKARVLRIRRQFEGEDYQEIKQVLSEWIPITIGEDQEGKRIIRQVLMVLIVAAAMIAYYYLSGIL